MSDDPGQATVFASAVEPPSLDGLLLAIEHDKVSRALFDAPGPQRAFGPYEVQGLLGRGGMGTGCAGFITTRTPAGRAWIPCSTSCSER